MKTPVDARFQAEFLRFRLRLFCEDCAHFEPQNATCGEGYPNAEHRRADLARVTEVCFCKSFELC